MPVFLQTHAMAMNMASLAMQLVRRLVSVSTPHLLESLAAAHMVRLL